MKAFAVTNTETGICRGIPYESADSAVVECSMLNNYKRQILYAVRMINLKAKQAYCPQNGSSPKFMT